MRSCLITLLTSLFLSASAQTGGDVFVTEYSIILHLSDNESALERLVAVLKGKDGVINAEVLNHSQKKIVVVCEKQTDIKTLKQYVTAYGAEISFYEEKHIKKEE